MGSGIHIAASGAKAQMQTMDVYSNNLSNVSTNGFQRQTVSFRSVLAGTPGAPSPDTAFVQVAEFGNDPKTGPIQETGNPLDLALVGRGYFGLETDQGIRYSRAGSFRLNSQHQLVNGEGYVARSASGGTLQVPADASIVEFSPNGAMYADGVEVGKLELVNINPKNLTRHGDNTYSSNGGIIEGEMPEVVSGALELSNMSVVSGMVRLIKTQRVYESLMGMITAYKRLDQKTVSTLR